MKRYTVEERHPKTDEWCIVWKPGDGVGWVQAVYLFDPEDLDIYGLEEPCWMERDTCIVCGATEYSLVS